MKINNFIFFITVTGLILTSCTTMRDNFLKNYREKEDAQHHRILSARTLPGNITAITDIPYTDSGHRGHLLDIYYPDDMEGPFPVVVNIHGGGFICENKENIKQYCYNIVRDGFIVFNINYRLVTEGIKVPGQIPDVINALDWIGNNIGQYPADAGKVYLIGHSAGGFLAAITALVSESERLQNVFNVNKPNIKIKALAVNCSYIEMARKTIKWRGFRWAIYEKGYKKQEYYKNLIIKDLPEVKLFPPVFVISNSDDNLNFMSFHIVDILKENNLEHFFLFMKGEERKLRHCFDTFNPDRDESIKIRRKMLKYFLQF
ncbi:MAG: alpha/beta hydrolase fold domain-containing protein [Treponema sp.]|nr:alpha/beta hydrolase fold domain-containing protein [Treponema sp.]